MPPKDDRQLPAPEVDITQTSWFRSFAPGSGGPHMDVLLFNQATIMKQNQDIRRMLGKYMKGRDTNRAYSQKASDKDSDPASQILANEDMLQCLLNATILYVEKGGEILKTRSSRLKLVARAWFDGMTLRFPGADDENDVVENGGNEEEDELGEERSVESRLGLFLRGLKDEDIDSLHVAIAKKAKPASAKPTGKTGSTTSSKSRSKRSRRTSQGSEHEESPADEEEEDEEEVGIRRRRNERVK